MKVYVATLRMNEYEEEPFNVGVCTTKEKAEKIILEVLKDFDLDAPLLSLEVYQAQEEPHFIYNIEEWEVE